MFEHVIALQFLPSDSPVLYSIYMYVIHATAMKLVIMAFNQRTQYQSKKGLLLLHDEV